MNNISFDQIGVNLIQLKFNCDECGTSVVSEEIEVPVPDIQVEDSRDSYSADEYARCMKCGKRFAASFYMENTGGNITIHNLNSDVQVELIELPELLEDYEDFYFDAIVSNSKYYETFRNEVDKLNQLNQLNISNPALCRTLQGQIYIGVVTCLETYLSDAFVNTVLADERYLRAFFKSFKDFAKQKVELNNVFDYVDKAEEIAKKAMLGVIYHDLRKVRGMYQDTFNIEFPNIADVHKATLIRHDLVHRNGRTKTGEEVFINDEIIEKLITAIQLLVNDIEAKLPEVDEVTVMGYIDDDIPF
ncbi:MAG: hypothetical protein H6688_00055 [Erysipelotrichaceae bacterium]|nr:hypothetical protein [Erysipelotrichaceae bacterium]